MVEKKKKISRKKKVSKDLEKVDFLSRFLHSWLFVFVLIILIALLGVTLFVILVEEKVIFLPEFKESIYSFNAEDKCGLIAGQLIHSIDDIDQCENSCRATCEVRGLDFYNSTFIRQDQQCHICSCECL